MPINKIRTTPRGNAAILAGALAATLSGWAAFTEKQGETPQSIRAAISQGITPAPVDLAIEKLIMPWEGLATTAYLDKVARPPIWTVCYGETRINGKPVTAGMRFSKAECKTILVRRVTKDFYLPLVDKVKNFTVAPDSVQASMISGAYNFGTPGQLVSTQIRFVSAGNWRAACEAQTAWNKAGKKVVPGLVNRREMGDAQRIGEAELCVSGI